MKHSRQGRLGFLALLLLAAAVPQGKAETLTAAVCNDPACTGGDDYFFKDNSTGDTFPELGALSFTKDIFGFSVQVNVGDSKPFQSNAMLPRLDLYYTITNEFPLKDTIYLYLGDTDFTTPAGVPQNFTFTVLGRNSTGDSFVGRAYGDGGGPTGDSILTMANLLRASSTLTASNSREDLGVTLTPSASPYALTVGVAYTAAAENNQTTGELHLIAKAPAVSAVPEPTSITLFGLGLVGLGAVRFRRDRRTQGGDVRLPGADTAA